MPTLLDIGSGIAEVPLPAHYEGWTRHRLDIDPSVQPDVLLDARKLDTLPASTYSAVYCSHNLEHYHRHEGLIVVRGMRHILKPDAFAEIRVPDMGAVMQMVAQNKLDIDDVLYHMKGSPILVRDVIYGYHREIEISGNDFFSHKTGFTAKSLKKFLEGAGFAAVYVCARNMELRAYAFCATPEPRQIQMLGLPEVNN